MRCFLRLMIFLLFTAGFFAHPQTAPVQYVFNNFVSNPQQYSLVSLTPLFPFGLNGHTFVSRNTVTLPTGGNSSVTFSNVYVGASYLVQFRSQDPRQPITAFTNFFPVSLAGTNAIDASQWVFYSFISQGPIAVTNIRFGNLTSHLEITLAASNAQYQALSGTTNIVTSASNTLPAVNLATSNQFALFTPTNSFMAGTNAAYVYSLGLVTSATNFAATNNSYGTNWLLGLFTTGTNNLGTSWATQLSSTSNSLWLQINATTNGASVLFTTNLVAITSNSLYLQINAATNGASQTFVTNTVASLIA